MRRSPALVAAIAVALALPLAPAHAAFRDVPASASYAHAVHLLEQLGVVNGFGDGTFRPSASVTRAEYLKILFGALNRSVEQHLFGDETSVELPFTDVPGGSWMTPYVRAAYVRGVTRGTTDTTFSPDRTVTLYEATRMLLALEFSPSTLSSTLLATDDATAKEGITAWLTGQNLVAAPVSLDRPLGRGAVCELLFRWIVVKKTDAARYDPSLDDDLTVVQLAVPTSDADAVRALKEVLDVVEANYLHSEDVHGGALDGAVRGVIDELGDPHSSFYSEEESREFLNQVNGVDVGIGVSLSMEPDALVVVRVLPASPAAQAGVVPGDRITRIDGYVVADDPFIAYAYLASLNTVGQLVTLDVLRVSGGKEELRIALAEIHQPAVEVKLLEPGLLSVRIWEFTPTVGDEFDAALASVGTAGIEGVLLDLRSNPGGLIESTVQVARHFLPSGTAVAIVENPRTERVLTVPETGELAALDIVVLVDGGSASAAEILAATLRDNSRAALVGETTYGKGTVQALIPVGSAELLRITVARWLTSTGASVSNVGLTPNLEVPMSYNDYLNGNDLQFTAGRDLLRNLTR